MKTLLLFYNLVNILLTDLCRDIPKSIQIASNGIIATKNVTYSTNKPAAQKRSTVHEVSSESDPVQEVSKQTNPSWKNPLIFSTIYILSFVWTCVFAGLCAWLASAYISKGISRGRFHLHTDTSVTRARHALYPRGFPAEGFSHTHTRIYW